MILILTINLYLFLILFVLFSLNVFLSVLSSKQFFERLSNVILVLWLMEMVILGICLYLSVFK